jgi:cation/acetate symporter
VQFIVVVLGVSVPLVAISIVLTNLPLPQLSYGGVLQDLAQLESARGLSAQGAQSLSAALPTPGASAVTQPFLDLFGTIGRGDFLALTFCIMLGTAVLPAQIARVATPPSVAGVRKAFGWAALFVGFMVLTVPAYAVFMKYQVLKHLLDVPLAQIPEWGRALSQLGLITLSGNQLDPALGSAKVLVSRDTALLMLPAINNFPLVLIGLAGAGAIAAVMAAAGGQLVALANVLSNDICYGVLNRSASPSRRLLTARLAMVGFALAAFLLASRPELDPLRMLLWAFSLAAGTFFAPLTLAIWWRGLTKLGVLAGMAAGFAVTAGYISLMAGGGYPWFGVDGLTAAVLGVPVSALAAFTGTLLSPRPDPQTVAIVDEMHIPSGDTIHARLTRLAARHKGPKP